LCCEQFFLPDPRNRTRQRYCCAAPCRRASKRASQAAWLAQPDNCAYFRDPVHVARVQAWRAAHPGYARGRRRVVLALQDSLMAQAVETIEETAVHAAAAAAPLQELFNSPTPVLAGLIAHLFEVTLQEDIAATARRLVQLGHDVISGRLRVDGQARAVARAATPGAEAVQLG
jgi:hypothetical protein